VFIALGSNLDDPHRQVRRAFDELAGLPLTRVSAHSALYRSAPLGNPHQPEFINAVARIETALAPHALLAALMAIEQSHGRTRSVPNAPRTLDLDLLLYGELTLHDKDLTLPHPRMHERAFVLAPLHEIAGDCAIPGRGRVTELLKSVSAQALERLK
jgi:2-amino-4-hydroxy-6-hydroxymethyldihydropteridine diphosphokinase